MNTHFLRDTFGDVWAQGLLYTLAPQGWRCAMASGAPAAARLNELFPLSSLKPGDSPALLLKGAAEHLGGVWQPGPLCVGPAETVVTPADTP